MIFSDQELERLLAWFDNVESGIRNFMADEDRELAARIKARLAETSDEEK